MNATIFSTIRSRVMIALVLAGITIAFPLTGKADSGQPALPKLFPGVQLGNVVMQNGTIRDTQAFDFRSLSQWVAPKSLSVERKEVSGNSTYSKTESGAATEMSAGLNIMDVVGISGYYNTSLTSADDFQGLRLEANFVGSNLMARIGFADMNPEELLQSLSESLQDERRSPLHEMIEALEDFREEAVDLNDPAEVAAAKDLIFDMVDAKEEFLQEYGVGFVSGVVLGGAAVVRLDFQQKREDEEDKYEGGGELSVGAPQGALKVSASHGEVSKEGFKEATFQVTSTAMGSEKYRLFADKYQEMFAGKSMEALWDTNLLEAPSSADLIGGKVPELPSTTAKPSSGGKSLVEKFGKIKSEEDIALLDSIIAFEAWNSGRDGRGTWDEFKQWREEQGSGEIEEELNPDEELADDPVVRRRSTAARKSAMASGAEPEPEASATPSVPQNAFNLEYLTKLQGDHAVIGVEITRWEDVIPGLGDVDSLRESVEYAGDLLQTTRILDRFERIANMYAFASTCMTNPLAKPQKERFLNFANIFRSHRALLAKELRTGESSRKTPLAIAKEYLSGMNEESRKIYNVFLTNEEIFASGEVGMGAYVRLNGVSSPLRVGHYHRNSSAISGLPAEWQGIFNIEMWKARNTPSELHGPTFYAESLKFLPVLDPDIAEYKFTRDADGKGIVTSKAKVWLMASDPVITRDLIQKTGKRGPGSNASLQTPWLSYFGSHSKYFQTFPLDRLKVRETFQRKEVVFTVEAEDYFVVGNEDNVPGQFVSGKDHWQEEGDLRKVAGHLWQNVSPTQGTYILRFHLVPFDADELKSVNWKGFLVYDDTVSDLIGQFWKHAVADLQPSTAGHNYWTEKFSRGRVKMNRNYSATVLRQFQSYFGLVERPESWN